MLKSAVISSAFRAAASLRASGSAIALIDWTLDDDIRKWLFVRRVLDGNFPPDRTDFYRLSDYDADENMNRVMEFLQRLNVGI